MRNQFFYILQQQVTDFFKFSYHKEGATEKVYKFHIQG
jgi:hypothetical protein